MNASHSQDDNTGLIVELRAFIGLCEKVLALAVREHQFLTGRMDYEPGEFSQRRKDLLPGLDSALIKLRSLRKLKQQEDRAGRVQSGEIKMLSQTIQALLMKILLLDRESQQLMLHHGLVPARHLPPADGQRPHYVAGLYQRHSPN